jgi:hypothetical protein
MQTITERPARVAGEIARRIATQERRAEKTRQRVRELREKASAEIERLIAFLDASDSYVMDEREPDDDFEPSLGFLNMFPGRGGASGGFVPDLELDDADDEPSLGSTSSNTDQTRWGASPSDDTEDEHDGSEPDHDAEDDGTSEPSLGWTTDGLAGGSDDREAQDHSRPQPQNRTDLEATLAVEQSYRKFIYGLTDEQRAAVRHRMHTDSGVLLR